MAARDPALVGVVFPRSAAVDANGAMDRLFDVFPDHQPTLVRESEAEWRFELRWASDPAAFVDPGVASAAADLCGLQLPGIGGYHRVGTWGGRAVVFSLVHGWALLAPALAMQRDRRAAPAWVVHVDDHTDLGPLAALRGSREGTLRDPIFGVDIDLSDPASVTAAIERGIVSKGNFLTAYLLAHPGTQVIHVGAAVTERSFATDACDSPVDLGGPPVRGSSIPLVRDPAPDAPAFRKTRALPTELPVGTHEGVWLDIDLDYFCNRFDGDSDRRANLARPGEREDVMLSVREFLAALSTARWVSQVTAISVAVSPGFFPAEYWADVTAALDAGIKRALTGG